MRIRWRRRDWPRINNELQPRINDWLCGADGVVVIVLMTAANRRRRRRRRRRSFTGRLDDFVIVRPVRLFVCRIADRERPTPRRSVRRSSAPESISRAVVAFFFDFFCQSVVQCPIALMAGLFISRHNKQAAPRVQRHANRVLMRCRCRRRRASFACRPHPLCAAGAPSKMGQIGAATPPPPPPQVPAERQNSASGNSDADGWERRHRLRHRAPPQCVTAGRAGPRPAPRRPATKKISKSVPATGGKRRRWPLLNRWTPITTSVAASAAASASAAGRASRWSQRDPSGGSRCIGPIERSTSCSIMQSLLSVAVAAAAAAAAAAGKAAPPDHDAHWRAHCETALDDRLRPLASLAQRPQPAVASGDSTGAADGRFRRMPPAGRRRHQHRRLTIDYRWNNRVVGFFFIAFARVSKRACLCVCLCVCRDE